MALDSDIAQKLALYQWLDNWINKKLASYKKPKLTAKAINSYLKKKTPIVKNPTDTIVSVSPPDRETLNAIELARLKATKTWPAALDPNIYWWEYTMTGQPNFQSIDWWLVDPLTQKIKIIEPVLSEEEKKKRKKLNSFEDVINYDFLIWDWRYT